MSGRGATCLALAAAGLAWAALASAEPEAAPAAPAAGASLAVAHFETQGPPGAEIPDVATLLADRLATAGASRVVGPERLGAPPQAEPKPEDVRSWASRAQVGAVVVGRTTRVGSALSIDVRLCDAASGSVAATYVQPVPRREQLAAAVNALASRLLAGAAALRPSAAVSSAPAPAAGHADAPAAGHPEAPAAASAAAPAAPAATALGFRLGKKGEPLSIKSEEMEAVEKQGVRVLRFSRDVRLTQGDMTIAAASLEAVYPKAESQPSRLVAEGGPGRQVEVAQGSQSARCNRATYDRQREWITCEGDAAFRDGDNHLSGAVIEVDLRNETVHVKGGAAVTIQPKEAPRPGATQAGGASGG